MYLFRDLRPPNSSSRLLITKILRSLASCLQFSRLPLPVRPPLPTFPSSLQQLAAAGYYWSALTSISAYRGVSHQNTHKHLIPT